MSNQKAYGTDLVKVVKVFAILSICMNSLVCIMIMNLIGFHIWLLQRGMTTYEYIIYQRDKITIKNKPANKSTAII
jgi:nitrate reductase NapE component